MSSVISKLSLPDYESLIGVHVCPIDKNCSFKNDGIVAMLPEKRLTKINILI